MRDRKQLTRSRPSAPWSVAAEAVGVSIALVIAGTVRCHQKARKHRIESAAAAADDAEAEAAIVAAGTKGRNPREGPSRPLMPPKNLQCALPLPPLMIPQPWMPPAVTTARSQAEPRPAAVSDLRILGGPQSKDRERT